MDTKPIKVLLIEDDEDDYCLVRDILSDIKGWHYDLEWVGTYEAGLEAICRNEYDICLLDYRLGERTGLDLLGETARYSCRVPIILLTGQGDHEVDVEAMNAGAADFLVKGQIDVHGLERSIRYTITRQQAEETLQREASMRSILLENLPCIAMILKKGTREIVYSNDAARKVGAVPGTTCYGSCAQRDDHCLFCLAPEVWATNTPRCLEVKYRGEYYEGIWVPLTDDLYVHYIFTITDRKKAEEQARKLSTAVEQSPAAVVITDTEGTIQYVNPMFTKATGYTAEEAIGQNPRILKSGEMTPDAHKHLWDTIVAGEIWRGEFHNKKKNGDLYWEAASISPIRDSQGTITHFLAVKEDITERKRAEEELAATVDELQRFNRLMVGREERMIELKREVNEMARKAGIAPPYDSALLKPARQGPGDGQLGQVEALTPVVRDD